jgi:hypothetical protein
LEESGAGGHGCGGACAYMVKYWLLRGTRKERFPVKTEFPTRYALTLPAFRLQKLQKREHRFATPSQPRLPMRGPATRARANWAVDRATFLSKVWAIVAKHLELVGAWRLMLVCRAAQLDLATLRWEAMPSPLLACTYRARCAVRGALVVFSGDASGNELFSSVEMLSKGEGPFKALSPLSWATPRMRLLSR